MTKIEREKEIVEQMICLYCKGNHRRQKLCPQCTELLQYACSRLDRCRFGIRKPSCKQCPVHCYKPDMRLRIRQVMRYAGPRMLLYHPISAFRHLL